MGKTTDELIALAKKVGDEVPKRELDALLAAGEQKTVALLAIALQNLGVPAVSLTGFQSGFITTEHHSKARIKEINTERLEQLLKEGKVVVLTGFQGISEEGISPPWAGADRTLPR
jgi:aspartate kinase